MARKVVCCFKPHVISYYACVPSGMLQQLVNFGFDFIYCESTEEFLKQLPEAEIAIAMDFKSEWIDIAPQLQWVATYAAGKERIAETALRKRGIQVSFGRFHGQIIAETVIGMMLFTARGLGTAYRLKTQTQWCDSILMEEVSILRGKICLILGMGSIGRYVARLTKTFGMFNFGVKRLVKETIPGVDKLITVDCLPQYLPMADHLVIILPGDSSTDNMVGPEQLALMKPTACIYNVGRGNCIDENALYRALKNKKLGWACLDVFQNEPLSMESPLRNLDNILILPHASAFAPEYFSLFFEEFVQDLAEYSKRHPILNRV